VNALHPEVAAALHARLADVGADADVRAVVITGAGKHFGAGGDIGYFRTLDRRSAERYVLAIQSMQDAIATLPQPAVAAINGTCLGGGLELALACDIRIADAVAVFALPEVTLGLISGAGGTQRLPRLIGAGAAKRLIFTGDRIDAARALELGLVEEVVGPGAAVEAAVDLGLRIARNAPLAVTAAKRAVDLGLQVSVLDGHRIEATLFAPLVDTADFQEGVAAFFARRPPNFERSANHTEGVR
jgi:enoyl-CoA hydratase/carnithine racemase